MALIYDIGTGLELEAAASVAEGAGGVNLGSGVTIYAVGSTLELLPFDGIVEGVGGAVGGGGGQVIFAIGSTINLAAEPAVTITSSNLIEDLGTPAVFLSYSASISALGFGAVTGGAALSNSPAEVEGEGTVERNATGSLLAGSATINYIEATTVAAISANLIAGEGIIFADAVSQYRDLTWEEKEGTWDAPTYTYGKDSLVFPQEAIFYKAEEGAYFNDEPVRVTLERTGLVLYGKDQTGAWKNDPGLIKFVNGVWPLITGPAGTEIKIFVGSQDSVKSPVSWEGPYSFTIGQDDFVDFTVSGRYIAIRFESVGQLPWNLLSYDLELTTVGQR